MVEVKIGVRQNPKELTLEIEDEAKAVVKRLDEALSKNDGLVWLTDNKGRQVVVPVDRIAYVEVSPEGGPRPVGFAGP